MNLAGKSVSEKKKSNKNSSSGSKNWIRRKDKAATKKDSKQNTESTDRVVLPEDNFPEDSFVDEDSKGEIVNLYTKVDAFEGGYVSPALRSVINSSWRRSAETDMFIKSLRYGPCIDGVFFGAIYVKSSFLRKTGGSALL